MIEMQQESGWLGGHRLLSVVRVVALVLISATVLRYAWITDDALITVRHALNVTHGWGLGFNIDERVQAYTHPLWFLLLTLAGTLTGSWAIAPILLGVICATAAAAVILWSTPSLPRVLIAASLLLLSNAFIEYSTSGLENSLSFLLLATAVALTARGVQDMSLRNSAALGVVSALVLLNRLDLVLILVAPLALVVLANRRKLRTLACLVLPPVVIVGGWLVFSQATYASLLPNTFLAKTNVDIPKTELIVQGIRYLYVSISNDPISGIVLLGSVVLAVFAGTTVARTWMLGVVAYLGYVVWIGGDFMAFRFLAVPVVVSVVVLAVSPWAMDAAGQTPLRQPTQQIVNLFLAILAAIGLMVFSWGRSDATLSSTPVEPRWAYYLDGQVSDERSIYAPWLGFWSYVQALGDTDATTARGNQGSRMVELTNAAGDWPPATSDAKVTDVQVQCGTLGQDAVLSGPLVHWIDTCALADRFLASRPYVAENYDWRVGHYARDVPAGYVEAVLQGSPVLLERPEDVADLATLWEEIR